MGIGILGLMCMILIGAGGFMLLTWGENDKTPVGTIGGIITLLSILGGLLFGVVLGRG